MMSQVRILSPRPPVPPRARVGRGSIGSERETWDLIVTEPDLALQPRADLGAWYEPTGTRLLHRH